MSPSKPRRRLTAQVRKDSIARAALPLFARKGLHGVTTREIAAASGVSEALLFQHFPTKEAMFNAMLHQYTDVLDTGTDVIRRLSPPSTAGLVELVFRFVRQIVVREVKIGGDMMHFFYRSFIEDGVFARRFLAGIRDWREYFEASLAAARARGDAATLETPGHNLFWFMQHVATAACLIRLPEKPPVRYDGGIETAVEQMVLFILRGLGLSENALRSLATPAAFAGWRRQMK